MSIGVMDADLVQYTLVPFNLEIMKISSYFKRQGELVVFSPDFSVDKHQKFYYRKDYNDGIFPSNLLQSGAEYGGLAFSNNKYIQMPLDFEMSRADPSIYSKMKIKFKDNREKRIFDGLTDCEHIRLSLDNKTIWADYGCQFKNIRTAKRLMLHDYDLGSIPGSFEEVKRIMSRARTDGWATKLGMKFPVQVSDGQSLLNWSSLNSDGTFYSLQYNGVIEDEPFMEWITKTKGKVVFNQIDYYVTRGDYTEDEFIYELLPRLLRQILISRSFHIFFSLKYDKGFFSDPRWEQVLRLFNFYHNSLKCTNLATYFKRISCDTLFDFAKACKEQNKFYGDFISKSEIREIFTFVREKNRSLFDDFYNCTAKKLEEEKYVTH